MTAHSELLEMAGAAEASVMAKGRVRPVMIALQLKIRAPPYGAICHPLYRRKDHFQHGTVLLLISDKVREKQCSPLNVSYPHGFVGSRAMPPTNKTKAGLEDQTTEDPFGIFPRVIEQLSKGGRLRRGSEPMKRPEVQRRTMH